MSFGLLFAFLAWSIVVQFAVQRLPTPFAHGLAPNSATVLTRIAEEYLIKSRFADAERLARAALHRQPFNVRALRTLGLAIDQRGEKAVADQLLTLAGNWSLRDTATHLWLYENRLRLGEYDSAFAHLDAVLRRRPELRPDIFTALQRGLLADRRGLAPIAKRLSHDPNWRAPFIAHLGRTVEGQTVAANLAIALKDGGDGLASAELEPLFRAMLASRNFGLIKNLAVRLDLGLPRAGLVDGDFEGLTGSPPFGWELIGGPGATVDIVTDEQSGSRVLSVEYDGYSGAPLVRQLTLLAPGAYSLAGQAQTDGDPSLLRWSVTCVESGARLPMGKPPVESGESNRFSARFQVPSGGCAVQWVALVTIPGERRSIVTATYDNIRVSAANLD